MKRAALVLSALLLPALLAPAPAFAKARLGFGVAVATDGFFSTTLTEVKITSVQPGSPSEKAGLRAGDVVVELDGTPVRGASGLALKKALAEVKPGQHVVLKVQRSGKGLLVIDIVAG